jgi:hypothetical protein
MRRVSKGTWQRKALELDEMAECLGKNRNRLSAKNYGASGFLSHSYVDDSIHFHEWGCDSNRFKTVKAICLFKVYVYGSHRYYIDEHQAYDERSNCRNVEKIKHALYQLKQA